MVSRFAFNLVRRRAGWSTTSALAACLLATPALAQDAQVQELRIRQLEAQVRELLRQPGAATASAPAPTPTTDMLTRMDALEAQVARLTAQNEEIANRLRQFQPTATAPAPAVATPAAPTPTPIAPAPAPVAAPAPTATPAATTSNLAAMTGGASTQPAAKPAAAPPAKASAQRLAAVKAIVKPQTRDAADDEYSYGFRLWQAGFFPEAAQQLKLYLDKYPRHADGSKARNLLGRALLDDGKPREAAPWFLQNYKSDPSGNRAADSLLNLADAMRQIGDTSRACIALNEFSTNYSTEARGRLKPDYDKLKGAVTCN
jgi:TolA-binding protein